MRLTRFFAVVMIGVLSCSISFGYSGGDGTAGNPYQIASKADLLVLGATPTDYTKCFILTADIDLTGETFTRAVIAPDTNSSTSTFEGTKFAGVFDGNGRAILNLTITGSDSYYTGLFGYVDTNGQVKNLDVKNIVLQGRDFTGGLVGYNYGKITCSYTAGSVNGQSYVGGLAGLNSGTITSSYAADLVNGTSSVGGLVGRQYSGSISSCCASGSVSGTGTYIGGLVGYNYSNTITTCYATGSVQGDSYVGGLAGYNNSSITTSYSTGTVVGTSYVGGLAGSNPNDSIKNSFWDKQSSGQNAGVGSGYSTGVTGKTTSEMKTFSTFADAGWVISDLNGFDADWIMSADGQDYPNIIYFVYDNPFVAVPLLGDGTSQNPYQIGSSADLVSLSQYGSVWDKHIILTDDLNMDGFNIRPIGNSAVRFTGTFNGQNHVIRNVTLNFPNKDYVGLFGYVGKGGVITDLSVEDVNVFGKRYIGGLAGYNSKSTISNCHSTGLAAGGSSCYVGGVIGFNIGGTVSNCSSSVNLTGSGASIGGLVGCNFTGSTLSNCFATGSITDNDPNQFGSYAGGLVGDNYSSTITNCRASGDISVTLAASSSAMNVGGLAGASRFGTISGSYAMGHVGVNVVSVSEITCGGGLIGLNSSDTVNDCYASGSVTFDCGTESTYYFGGLIGLNFEGTVNRCYSRGIIGTGSSVEADCCVGGFVGYNMVGNVYGCFWDVSSSGKTTSGGGKGLATEQMKTMSIYQNAGWADHGWIIDDGQDYPRLVWEGTDGVAIPLSSTVELAGSGTSEDPYQIWTIQDFELWGQYASVLDKHTILMADLDLTGVSFNPIGEYGLFTGTFDGNGHVIGNIMIVQPNNCYVGLFGHVGTGGVITDIGIENVIIAGGDYVGGLIGKIEGGTVNNCYVNGTVDGFAYVGGLIGDIESGTVNHCYSDTTVTSWDSNYGGGLIGYNNSASVSQCYAKGQVTGSGSNSSYIGGLAGYNSSETITSSYATCTVNGSYYVGGFAGSTKGTIRSCCAEGSVAGNGFVGGFVGESTGTISDCYANVSTNASGSRIGGFAGSTYGSVSKCYSTGRVQGTYNVGGLVGYYYGTAASNCFWDTQTSGKTSSAGGTGKTTIQMKTLSTFTSAGWDFVNTWAMCEGTNYPRLRWQIPSGDFVCPDGVSVEDLNYFVGQWLLNNCTSSNNYCGGVDINASGKVDLGDWAVFAGNWLEGV